MATCLPQQIEDSSGDELGLKPRTALVATTGARKGFQSHKSRLEASGRLSSSSPSRSATPVTSTLLSLATERGKDVVPRVAKSAPLSPQKTHASKKEQMRLRHKEIAHSTQPLRKTTVSSHSLVNAPSRSFEDRKNTMDLAPRALGRNNEGKQVASGSSSRLSAPVRSKIALANTSFANVSSRSTIQGAATQYGHPSEPSSYHVYPSEASLETEEVLLDAPHGHNTTSFDREFLVVTNGSSASGSFARIQARTQPDSSLTKSTSPFVELPSQRGDVPLVPKTAPFPLEGSKSAARLDLARRVADPFPLLEHSLPVPSHPFPAATTLMPTSDKPQGKLALAVFPLMDVAMNPCEPVNSLVDNSANNMHGVRAFVPNRKGKGKLGIVPSKPPSPQPLVAHKASFTAPFPLSTHPKNPYKADRPLRSQQKRSSSSPISNASPKKLRLTDAEENTKCVDRTGCHLYPFG